jgi:adenine-specific DNA-methyltransferase
MLALFKKSGILHRFIYNPLIFCCGLALTNVSTRYYFILSKMPDLNDLIQWKNLLGLLPINLSSIDAHARKYILLNGGSGDFCLQLNENNNDSEFYFSAAWSSNTKNFVTYGDDGVNIYNWKKAKKESITKEAVDKNFSKFYEYLIANSYTSELDIVPFLVNIFKKLRNLLNDQENPDESLNLLFILLSSLEDDQIANIHEEKWGVVRVDLPNEFENYILDFKTGIANAKPTLDLILRHSSGLLFQEAQKEVLFFNKQQDLFSGTLSGSYSSKRKLYSSIHYTPAYLARTIVENALN